MEGEPGFYDPAKDEEILRLKETSNLRNNGTKVAKSLAVARSVNFAGRND